MSDNIEGEIPKTLDWATVTAALEALGIPNIHSLRAVEIDPHSVNLRYLLRTETRATAVGVVEFVAHIPYRYPDQQPEGSEPCRSPKAETPPGHHASSTPSSPASTPGTPGTPETPTT